MPVFLLQDFDQFFGQNFDQDFWPGFGGQKVQGVTVLQGRNNTVLQFYRDGETLEKDHVIKKHILLNIPYIKNQTVRGVEFTLAKTSKVETRERHEG